MASSPLSVPQTTAAASVTACTHCGLPVPAGLVVPEAARQFCCAGCRSVYEVIHDCGLEQFYRLRAAEGWQATPASAPPRAYSEYDDPTFQELYCRRCGELASCELLLEGVHCAACVWLIERLPRVVPGVLEARLEWTRATVRVTWDPARATLSQIARALSSLGYPPHPARGRAARDAQRSETRRQLIRIGIAGACAGNAMLLAIALYGGMFAGMEPVYETLLRRVSMGIGLVALAWPGATFFRGAWAAIRTRTAHLDQPIALGLLVGGLAGTINAIRGTGDIYFDSLTVLVFLLLVGRFIQSRQQRRAADALELLFALTPHSARRVEADGRLLETAIEALKPGDRIEVRAGESLPVDGRIASGRTLLDESLLTGEPRPIGGGPGREVFAGTLNLEAAVQVEVAGTGEQTRVGRLMQLVAQAAQRRAPIVQLADRIAGWFVVAVIALAALTFAGWSLVEPAAAAEHTIALLIIACPCALGLATPLSVAVAIGRSARRGILIKGGDVLERLSRPGLMLLDKTGTLTTGRFELRRWVGPDDLQPAVAALEEHSAHPIARALRVSLSAGRDAAASLTVTDVHQDPAGGISGRVAGRRLVVGAPRFVAEQVGTPAADLQHATAEFVRIGLTPLWIACDGRLAAVAALGDALRGDSLATTAALRAAGWKVGVLSGDHPEVVAALAGELGLCGDAPIRGGVTPEHKLAEVERLRSDTVSRPARSTAASVAPAVVMVGDGVNDAAALAAADVGIAVHGGAEASLAAADVYLNRPGVGPIVELLTLSRSTMRAIRTCLWASLAYNAFGVTLAALGWLNPLVAAVLMPISSLTVLSLALGVRQPPGQTQGSGGTATSAGSSFESGGSGDERDRRAADLNPAEVASCR